MESGLCEFLMPAHLTTLVSNHYTAKKLGAKVHVVGDDGSGDDGGGGEGGMQSLPSR